MTTQSVLAPEQIEAIRDAFKGSSLIVEHRFLSGGRSPDSFVFDDFEDFEDFEQYLHAKAKPGDNFWFWRYADWCRDDNAVARGKYPNADGSVLDGGSY